MARPSTVPPLGELRPSGVLVATRRHRWTHWSPRPMVEIEGVGTARLSDERWQVVVLPDGGATLTFFCWDLLQPRFATYAVRAGAGDVLIYDAGARMPWSRRVVRRYSHNDSSASWDTTPKLTPRRFTAREQWRGLLKAPHEAARPYPAIGRD